MTTRKTEKLPTLRDEDIQTSPMIGTSFLSRTGTTVASAMLLVSLGACVDTDTSVTDETDTDSGVTDEADTDSGLTDEADVDTGDAADADAGTTDPADTDAGTTDEADSDVGVID